MSGLPGPVPISIEGTSGRKKVSKKVQADVKKPEYEDVVDTSSARVALFYIWPVISRRGEASPMSSHDVGPEWILSTPDGSGKTLSQHTDNELIVVARRLWPRVQAHARRERGNTSFDDSLVLASEVWEGVLQSVSKTLHRLDGKSAQIVDLDGYLFGAFHHRFNRAMKKERRRQEMIQLVPLSRDLELFAGAQDSKAVHDLERSVLVKEVTENMDAWTRKVWIARHYGYSWKEVAEHVGLREQQAKLRFRYAMGKLRARLGGGI